MHHQDSMTEMLKFLLYVSRVKRGCSCEGGVLRRERKDGLERINYVGFLIL